MLRRLLRLFRRKAPPRASLGDPWLDALFARLGERYQLAPDRARILPLNRLRHDHFPAAVPDGTGGFITKPAGW